MKKILISVVMFFCFFSACFAQFMGKKGLFIGGGLGDTSLNTDNYLYNSENNSRVPELNIRQRIDYSGNVYTLFVGYNFLSKDVKLLDNETTLVLGAQSGYTNLGKHEINVMYFTNDFVTGYRHLTENTIDLTMNASIYFSNNFNVFTRIGAARLAGNYKQKGLLSSRQPEFSPQKEQFDMVAYRKEFAFGVGCLLFNQINIFVQYTSIEGNDPNTKDRIENDILEMPTQLYRAGLFSAGLSLNLY